MDLFSVLLFFLPPPLSLSLPFPRSLHTHLLGCLFPSLPFISFLISFDLFGLFVNGHPHLPSYPFLSVLFSYPVCGTRAYSYI